MAMHPFVLVDADRAALFSLIPFVKGLWRTSTPWIGKDENAWHLGVQGSIGIGFTWLGPGWVFDPQAQTQRADELQTRMSEMSRASSEDHVRELAHRQAQLRLGAQAQRLLWAIHATVLSERTSLLCLSDVYLAGWIWAGAKKPRHWRRDINFALHSLSWLHVFASDDNTPSFGVNTVLITHVGDLIGTGGDACPPYCPDIGRARHSHFQIDVGLGFLGCLEKFGRVNSDGVRTYLFPVQGQKRSGPTLRAVGKSGQLVTAYLPAVLGARMPVDTFTVDQHRLLKAIVREQTRAPRAERQKAFEAEVIQGNVVPGFAGKKKKTDCPLLDSKSNHVAFNGNGKIRKGQGYKLATWLTKAAYAVDEHARFLNDLQLLAGRLALKVVALDRNLRWYSLEELNTLTLTVPGRRTLDVVHLRVYAGADYLACWNRFFQWDDDPGTPSAPETLGKTTEDLVRVLNRKGISRRALARGLSRNHSFIVRMLGGKKPWPAGLLDKAIDWAETQEATRKGGLDPVEEPDDDVPSLKMALEYLEEGWSIVPQLPGAKKPCVKWKEFQDRRPYDEELVDWFERWPKAGLALVLGPISGILVVDVDGPEAHEALLERLGREPQAPKAISGSRKPFRYHLYFRHPDLATKAKSTPWHPKLEFRGKGGIVVIPPSLHKSGNRYAWARGRSLDDLSLPDLPRGILEALKPLPPRGPAGPQPTQVIPRGIGASASTRAFLSGKFAEGPNWNDRLFKAACDLCARNLPVEEAEQLLLAGACPWNMGEEESARRTILSAYSRPREPARW